MSFKFENLKVWHSALDLSEKINLLTKSFPKEEMYILTSQFKRAADSVVLNIAEGSTLHSNAEFIRFLVMANRSAIEVVACLYIAKKRTYINEGLFSEYYNDYLSLVKQIQALINSIKIPGQ
ncbi:MAG: four helix bundle protein [Ferruginibacter sp.]